VLCRASTQIPYVNQAVCRPLVEVILRKEVALVGASDLRHRRLAFWTAPHTLGASRQCGCRINDTGATVADHYGNPGASVQQLLALSIH
jgi:hypothetical protein